MAFEKEQTLQRERGRPVLALIPLDLDGYLFSDKCKYPKASQIRKRACVSFAGWEHDNTLFGRQFERVVEALRADEGSRKRPPRSKL
jgi:hypothetical protein